MESAAKSDASGVLAAPGTPRRSIEVRQHLATCEIGILGGIVGDSAGEDTGRYCERPREALTNLKLPTVSGGSYLIRAAPEVRPDRRPPNLFTHSRARKTLSKQSNRPRAWLGLLLSLLGNHVDFQYGGIRFRKIQVINSSRLNSLFLLTRVCCPSLFSTHSYKQDRYHAIKAE